MKNPPGIKYEAEYEPDMERMVKALRVVKEAPMPDKEAVPEKDELQEGA